MVQEAIKQLWRAKTRAEVSSALDMIENCSDDELGALSSAEFLTACDVARAKERKLTSFNGVMV